MKNPRVIFAGTPEFALASLSALVDAGVVPIAVLTQPDRPAGRGKRMTASPVKRYAEAHAIPVLQPHTLRDDRVAAEIAALKPDLMIVAAYGLILPQNVLDIPTRGCLNVHASVLPRWRGAAPIQAAILAGDETTGVSLMSMTAGLDCGPVFVVEEISIGANETTGELHDRLAKLGGEMLVTNLGGILDDEIAAESQDESLASYAAKIKTSDAELDWSQPAVALERHIRAYNPEPGAFFYAQSKTSSDPSCSDPSCSDPSRSDPSRINPLRIKCWRAESCPDISAAPGTIVDAQPDEILVACGTGGLRLQELQLPGKRRAEAREFKKQLDLSGQELS